MSRKALLAVVFVCLGCGIESAEPQTEPNPAGLRSLIETPATATGQKQLFAVADQGLYRLERDGKWTLELPDWAGDALSVLEDSEAGLLLVGTAHGLFIKESGQ